MWFLLYNLVLTSVFVIALPLVPLILVLGDRYRTGLGQRFGFYPQGLRALFAAARPVWIHAASVGEVRSAEPLVRKLKEKAPERKVLVSTFTATGNRIAAQITGVDAAIFLPVDCIWLARRALTIFNPSLLVLIETEIWPNLLREAYRRGVPTVLLSGRLSEKALTRYWRCRGLFRRALGFFTAMGMQSDADAARVIKLGAPPAKVTVVGSLKYAWNPADGDGRRLARWRDPRRRVLVAGSSHRGEEEILLEALRAARADYPDLSMVLAPRHPERFAEVEKLLVNSPFAFDRKSRSSADCYFTQDVLLLDTVGELADFFAAGDIAFVGGSLIDVGGHNVLEPARFRKPILFGPFMSNFKTVAEELIKQGAAIEVRGASDLARVLVGLLVDTEKRRRMGEAAWQVAGAEQNAFAGNLRLAERYL
ncbi:MAG: 3-deoxy-D-manno-octulosonic acid transferase [Chloroflexota bacterium]